jgi:hypothetical protein
MSRISDLAASKTLQTYAQGLTQEFMSPVADFLAPTVNVASPVGDYSIYDEKHRFKIPVTARQPGERATQITIGASKGTYNCKHNALDAPVDNLEQAASAEQGENMLMEAAQMCAEVAGLAHENTVIAAAVAQLTGGASTLDFATSTTDVVDEQILAIAKQAGGAGGILKVGVLFGATAARKFKNHATVRSRFTNNAGRGTAPSPTFEEASGLLLGRPQVMLCTAMQDSAVEGAAASYAYLLDNKIIIFVRSPSPTRRDPSFMKTFRLMGKWMVPGTYQKEDGRGEVAKFDWSEDVKITNSSAAKLLNGN